MSSSTGIGESTLAFVALRCHVDVSLNQLPDRSWHWRLELSPHQVVRSALGLHLQYTCRYIEDFVVVTGVEQCDGARRLCNSHNDDIMWDVIQ